MCFSEAHRNFCNKFLDLVETPMQFRNEILELSQRVT